MKKTLITGGSGFLGSHLCEKLLNLGNEVICVDNFYTGAKQNIAHLLDNPYFEVIRHDVCFPLYVEVDEIYNLACPASRFTTSLILCKLPKQACMAQSICWDWQNALKQRFYRHQPPNCMAIRKYILSRKAIGAG